MGTVPAVIFDALPWWIATPLLQITLLVTGMALDETYVNRMTVLAGAFALYVHSVAGSGLWMPVGLYMDVGLVVGAYGLYAYVVDGYVGNWFRVLAYFVYSPLSILLVIIFPDVLFLVALLLAGYVNIQLLAYFHPVEPYYFGPESEELYEEIADETGSPDPVVTNKPAASEHPTGSPGGAVASAERVGKASRGEHATTTRDGARPGAEPAGSRPDERGILPEFMRRL